MRTTENGIALIRRFEAFRPDWYVCSAGVQTIGYGHTEAVRDGEITDEDLPAGYSAPLTRQEGEDLLRLDLTRYENAVREAVEVDLSPHQFDALVSFTYNCGVGALRGSTLLKKVNQGDHEAAAEELLRWKYADGEVLEGLLRRRKAEAALYRQNPQAAFEIEPAPIDPLPVAKIPARTDLSDPSNYPIRSVS